MTPLINTQVVKTALTLYKELMGGSLDIKLFGLSEEQFDRNSKFFPSKPYILFMNYAVQQLPAKDIAYFFNAILEKVSVPDTLAYFEPPIENVEDVLEQLISLTRKLMPQSNVRLEKGITQANIKREKQVKNIKDETAADLYAVFYIVSLISKTSDRGNLIPVRIELISPYSQRLEQVFSHWKNCEVSFDSKSTAIIFPIDWLNYTVTYDSRKFAIKKEQAMAYSFIDSIKYSMDSFIGQTNYNIDTIADNHGVSARTLQNQLRVYDKTYQDLKDEVLLENVQQLFRQPQLTLTTIALSLGYASLSQFSRSVKRLTGLPPSTYRKNMLKGTTQTK